MGTMAPPQPAQPELNQEAQFQGAEGQHPQQAQASEERSKDAPVQPADYVELTTEEQNALLDLIDRYTLEWAPIRRPRIRKATKSREYFKGNQYISFDSDNFAWFDPLETMFDGDPEKEDLGVYRYVNNIHQMLALSFVAALSPQVPKTQYMPVDAERLEDLATSKAGSRLQAIIERQNKMKSLQKLELLLLWTDGRYFKYQRFLVDSDRTKTHREPQWGMVSAQLPNRFECPNCGTSTSATMMPPTAQAYCAGDGLESKGCGMPLDGSNFYPGESFEVPSIVGYKDVPNGQVAIDVFGILNVTVAPWAGPLYESPMLKLDKECDIGSLRSSYPEKWDELKRGDSNSGDTLLERTARQRVLNMIGGRNNMATDQMPTFSRTWLRPYAFASMDDRGMAQNLMQKFPDGVMVAHVGRTFLEARKDNVLDHWTWGGTIEGYGAYPPAVGDCVLDVQDRLNDAGNSTAEHMDRNACGVVLVDGSAVDTRRMNSMPMLAGVLTEVPRKGTNQNRPLKDFIQQIQIGNDPHIYEYMDKLLLFAQLVSGVLPQIFGGSDPNVKTAAGQRQMLNTALGRLGLFWDNLREEHANSSGLCVRIAAKSYTEDILDVVAVGDKNFRNEYVRINDLSGEFHAYAETDQGFPQTYAEIQQRLQDMFAQGEKTIGNQMLGELLSEPTNQKTFARYLLPDNIILPNDAHTTKCTRIVNELLKSGPRQLPDPKTGLPVMVPSIIVDQRHDKPDVIIVVIDQWAAENYMLQNENPKGWANVNAYYDMAKELAAQRDMEDQVRMAAAAGAMGAGGKEEAKEPAPAPS